MNAKKRRQRKTDLTGYLFILPNMLGMILFTLIPMLFSLLISFTDWNFVKGFGNWNYIGFENYLKMWKDEWFLSALCNTVILAFICVPVTIGLALIAAAAIDRFAFGKLPVRLAMFMPYISNVVAVTIVWVMMYSPWGPFTQMVKMMGVKDPPQWLGDYTWALPAIILMMVWSNVVYCVMIYTSAIQGLPRDVYEAAEMDGAGEICKFFRLTVPFLSPTTFFLVITLFINVFQLFAQVQIMTKGGPGTSTNVMVYYIYKSAFNYYSMGYAAAMSWILFAILLVITLIQWKGQKRWVSY